jgi:hypothetical protein
LKRFRWLVRSEPNHSFQLKFFKKWKIQFIWLTCKVFMKKKKKNTTSTRSKTLILNSPDRYKSSSTIPKFKGGIKTLITASKRNSTFFSKRLSCFFLFVLEMSNTDLLNRGLSLVSQAAQADSNGDLAAALKLYTLGIECFMSMMRSYDNPTVVNKLKPKVAEYLTRCEQISAQLHPKSAVQQHHQVAAATDDDIAFPSPPDSLVLEAASTSTTSRRR